MVLDAGADPAREDPEGSSALTLAQGSGDAALVAMLVATGLTAGPALSAVLLFRAVTFWAPVPVGLLFARGLRHRHAL